jgi:hypothetical protein
VVPVVKAIAPLSGGPGTEVTISGENFGARAVVWFGSASCPVVRREGKTTIVVTIPPGVTGREYFVVADGGKKASSEAVFESR